MRSDLIFKEKSQTINIRKGMFLNINCLQFMLGNIPSLILTNFNINIKMINAFAILFDSYIISRISFLYLGEPNIHIPRGIETVHRQDSSPTRILKTVHRQN